MAHIETVTVNDQDDTIAVETDAVEDHVYTLPRANAPKVEMFFGIAFEQ